MTQNKISRIIFCHFELLLCIRWNVTVEEKRFIILEHVLLEHLAHHQVIFLRLLPTITHRPAVPVIRTEAGEVPGDVREPAEAVDDPLQAGGIILAHVICLTVCLAVDSKGRSDMSRCSVGISSRGKIPLAVSISSAAISSTGSSSRSPWDISI